jgi:hypothetical protein
MTTEVRVHVDLNYLWNAIAESQDFTSEKVTGRVTINCADLARRHLYRLEKNDLKRPESPFKGSKMLGFRQSDGNRAGDD